MTAVVGINMGPVTAPSVHSTEQSVFVEAQIVRRINCAHPGHFAILSGPGRVIDHFLQKLSRRPEGQIKSSRLFGPLAKYYSPLDRLQYGVRRRLRTLRRFTAALGR